MTCCALFLCWLGASLVGSGAGSTSTSTSTSSTALPQKKKKLARDLKPKMWANLERALQQTTGEEGLSVSLPPIANRTYGHLLEICMDAEGEPNPRITCQAGYEHAALYVSEQMLAMGLTPLGDDPTVSGDLAFRQTIPSSVHPDYCPFGITNIIGMVNGTRFPQEYVVYTAHLDGPRNDNPQTSRTRQEKGVSNAYDDALAVAVGLAIAEELMQDPPEYSVVILISDGEEGWSDVGPRGFYQECQADSQCNQEWLDPVIEESFTRYIGISHWLKNPTVPVADVKLIYAIDPLGSPFKAPNNTIAALGGDQTVYRSGNETLDDFLDEIWPESSETILIKGPRISVQGFGTDGDAFQRFYTNLCGTSCLMAGGVPSIWLAEPAFQKYHSGFAISLVKNLFGSLIGEGAFPSTAYFSVDNLTAHYIPNLNDVVLTLLGLVRNTANSDSLDQLAFDRTKGSYVNKKDLENVANSLDFVLFRAAQYPTPTQQTFVQLATQLQTQILTLSNMDLTNPQIQSQAVQISVASVGLAIATDFFNDEYPNGEAYLNQTFVASNNAVASEPFPTASPTKDSTDSLRMPTMEPDSMYPSTRIPSVTMTAEPTSASLSMFCSVNGRSLLAIIMMSLWMWL